MNTITVFILKMLGDSYVKQDKTLRMGFHTKLHKFKKKLTSAS